MDDRREWRKVAEFGAGYEADAAEAVLAAYDIPVLRDGPEVGIFGPGFAGATAKGVTLHVPADRWDEAKAALDPPAP
jgi:hypothetical protein